jgi:poly-gamma-glutamate synthesis protein (capsule biosynthesis protein)
VHFTDHVAALLDEPRTSLDELRPHLAAADIAMVNLETAVTTRGSPAPKAYHFRTSPNALDALSAAGVDVVTMANNHAVDFGRTGLSDTLNTQQESPIPIVGIGPDAGHAYAPAILTVRGVRVAVLGASQINDWTLQNWTAGATTPGIASAVPSDRLETAVRQARTRAELVVVYLHWGTEGLTCPTQAQESLAKDLAAAGADIVVGSHAHRVQGDGWLGDTFVDYGLGNFIWYNTSSSGSYTTGVLTVTVQGRSVVASGWSPLRIARSGLPGDPSPAVLSDMARSWRQVQTCTGLSDRGPTS